MRCLVLYGSQTGAAKSIAEGLHREARERGHDASLAPLNDWAAAGLDAAPNGALLARFAHVVLLSSDQDLYAPEPSVAVQWADAPLRDAAHGPAHGEMVRAFWAGVRPERVVRWSVAFHGLDSLAQGRLSLEGLVGRQAHLAMLESEALAHALALRLAAVWSE